MAENTTIEPVELGQELAELCRRHGITSEQIHQSNDLDDLVGRVLEDCGRLVDFARRASHLRGRTGEAPALVGSIDDLEKLRHGTHNHDVLSGEMNRDELALELLGSVSQLCHKINNPLTSLMGRAQILQMKKDGDPAQIHKAAQVIEESARRVASLVQELGQLVHRGKEQLLSK